MGIGALPFLEFALSRDDVARGKPDPAPYQEACRRLQLPAADVLVVEDSDVKRDALRQFLGAHAGDYLVDTHFTDYFGRNATCAADSIFVRMKTDND